MEEKSKFFKRTVTSGLKVQSSRSLLTADSTINKFTLNDAARSLMGVGPGDHVIFVDMFGTADCDSMENRFYITKGYLYDPDDPESWKGYKIGANKSFNASGVWSAIINGNHEVKYLRPEDLVAEDLVTKREYINKKGEDDYSYISNVKVEMELEKVSDDEIPFEEDVNGDEVSGIIYKLTNFRRIDHTPKELNAAGEEIEVEDEIEQ